MVHEKCVCRGWGEGFLDTNSVFVFFYLVGADPGFIQNSDNIVDCTQNGGSEM